MTGALTTLISLYPIAVRLRAHFGLSKATKHGQPTTSEVLSYRLPALPVKNKPVRREDGKRELRLELNLTAMVFTLAGCPGTAH